MLTVCVCTYVCVCVYQGTPLGDKTMEVAQKVATDTAEELKKSAAALDREIPGKRRAAQNTEIAYHVYSYASPLILKAYFACQFHIICQSRH